MEFQYFERTLILAFMLTSQVLSPVLAIYRGLKLWLLVHHVSVYQINCHLKLTSSKDLVHGMISLNQL